MFGQGYIFTGVWFCPQGGRHAWPGGVHGQGVCMARGACMVGHTWQGACVVVVGGACMVVVGVCVAGEGACMTCTPPRQILRLWHTVNEWAVCILLECILVLKRCHTVGKWVNPYNIRKSWFSFTMGVYEDIFIVFYIFPHLNGGTEFF